MIVFPGVRGIIRRVGIPTLPEVPLTVTPTLWYRPEYIYDGLGNLIATNDTPVEYWQPYNNLGTSVFNLLVDGGGGGGGTTSFIQQNPTADYGGMYLSEGTLSNNVRQLKTIVDGNPIEFIGGTSGLGPVYKNSVSCMGNRPVVLVPGDNTGGYLKANTNVTARYSTSTTTQVCWMFSMCICLSAAPAVDTTLITLGNAANDNVYYTISADSTRIYMKAVNGTYTVVSGYTTNTPYRITFNRYVRTSLTTNTSAKRVYVNGVIVDPLGATPTNFYDGVVFFWQIKLFNLALFHVGDIIYYNSPSASQLFAQTPTVFHNYMNTKYGASN